MQEIDPAKLPPTTAQLVQFIKQGHHRTNARNDKGAPGMKRQAVVSSEGILQPVKNEKKPAKFEIVSCRAEFAVVLIQKRKQAGIIAYTIDPRLCL